ncbi:MAG: sodium:proton exchanger [Chloroflexi bacterium]|nr:sodium:proton exchanger [Chloroflexota bacterium]
MIQILIFLILVFLYILISKRVERSVITGPMVFTLAGIGAFFMAPAISALFPELSSILNIANPTILIIGELTLAVILFSDSTRISFSDVIAGNRLPARLLGIGMPLTILAGALVAIILIPDLPIWEAAILATVLAPTDASLGAAVVESKLVPPRIRQALTVESGLNDGLSMPFLVLFIALTGFELHGGGESWLVFTAEQIGFGILVGLGIGWVGGRLMTLGEQRGWIADGAKQLAMLALAILAWLAADSIGGNGFIAAFVAGGTLRMGYSHANKSMGKFMEGGGDLLIYFIFFFFGLVAAPWLQYITPTVWLYGILSLTLVRILPVALATRGANLQPASTLFLGWFGPRGLASIVLGLIYVEELTFISLNSAILLAMIATVLLSIYAHGVSANPLIKLYARRTSGLAPEAPENT